MAQFTATMKGKLAATYFCLSFILLLSEPATDASIFKASLLYLASVTNFIIACRVAKKHVDISNIDNHGS